MSTYEFPEDGNSGLPKHVERKQCAEYVLYLVHEQTVKEVEPENYCDYVFLFILSLSMT
jgi:hypothetical protein